MLTKNKQEKSFYTFFFSVDKVSSIMQNHIYNKLDYFGKRNYQVLWYKIPNTLFSKKCS